MRNKKFNYEFKIPKNWTVKDGVAKQEGLLVIKDENNKESLTISTVQPRKKEKLFKGLCYDLLYKEDTTKCKKAENGVLNYRTGLGYAYNTIDYDTKESGSNERFIILVNKRLTFSIVDYNKNTKVIDNILNSINVDSKRVDVMPIDAIKHRLDGEFKLDGSIDTSNWKTYKNEKYGYKLKIPEDWMCFEEADEEKYKKFNKKSIIELTDSLKRSIKKAEKDGDTELLKQWQEDLNNLKTEPYNLYNTAVICLNKKDKQHHINQNWGVKPELKPNDYVGYKAIKIGLVFGGYDLPLRSKYAPLDNSMYKSIIKVAKQMPNISLKYAKIDNKNVFIEITKSRVKKLMNVDIRHNSRLYRIFPLRMLNDNNSEKISMGILDSFKFIN